MALDLRSFLAGEPVTARPVTLRGRVYRRLWRKRRVLAGVATLLAVAAAAAGLFIHLEERAQRIAAVELAWRTASSALNDLEARERELGEARQRTQESERALSPLDLYEARQPLFAAEAAVKVLQSEAFRARLGDPSYATRIGVQIVLETLGAESETETGFGLWTSVSGPDDNEYRVVVIDVNDASVFVTEDWANPKTGDQVKDPTAEELSGRMSSS